MAETKRGLSNIRSTQTKKPDRTQVLTDLNRLRAKLKDAEAQNDNGTVMMTRHDIDERLEQLHQLPDPAGVATEAEWGTVG